MGSGGRDVALKQQSQGEKPQKHGTHVNFLTGRQHEIK